MRIHISLNGTIKTRYPPPRKTKQKGAAKRWTTGGDIWKITNTDASTSTHVSLSVPQLQPCRKSLHVRHLAVQPLTGQLYSTSAYRSPRVATSTAICFVYGVSWCIPQWKFAISRGNGPLSGWWVGWRVRFAWIWSAWCPVGSSMGLRSAQVGVACRFRLGRAGAMVYDR